MFRIWEGRFLIELVIAKRFESQERPEILHDMCARVAPGEKEELIRNSVVRDL